MVTVRKFSFREDGGWRRERGVRSRFRELTSPTFRSRSLTFNHISSPSPSFSPSLLPQVVLSPSMSFTSFLSDRSSSKLPPPQPDNPSTFLQTASFSTPSSSQSSSSPAASSETPSFSAESLFGGASTYDPAQLHPMAGLGSGKQLEYLTLEDDKTNLEGGAMMGNRGFMDDVQTGTGTAYVTGTFDLYTSFQSHLSKEEETRQGRREVVAKKKTSRADLSPSFLPFPSLPSSLVRFDAAQVSDSEESWERGRLFGILPR